MPRRMARRVLPDTVFRFLKRQAKQRRKRRLERFPKLSEAAFRRLLTERLHLRAGSVVFIHSSTDSMNLGFPLVRVLPILQETVVEEGPLLFPCYHIRGRAEEYLRRGDVFDVANTGTVMGILPELARRQKGAFRSLHPTNSVVAIGKHAQVLTKTHPESIYPCGEQSPYYKIVHYDGIVIGLGVDTRSLSLPHCIEDIWQDRFPLQTRMPEVFPAKVIDWDGREGASNPWGDPPRIACRKFPRSGG